VQALLEQDIDSSQYELIVIVDGSTDETENMLLSIRARCHFRFVSQSNYGPASARNRGLCLAQGQIVVFVDDDMLVHTGFLRAHLAAHQRHLNSAIVGSVEMVSGEVSGAALAVYQSLQNRQLNYFSETQLHSPFDLLGGNFSIHRHLLLSLDGFDASLPLCEDFDLGLRLLKREVSIWYCCEAKSTEVYTRGIELVTRDAYRRGIAHGIIAKRDARAGVLLGFQRFFLGHPIKRIARRVMWLSAPALSPLTKRFAAMGVMPPAFAKVAEKPIIVGIIGGIMYWSGLQKSIGPLCELKRLAASD
jgi:glycosyltransferase involved in cell wall biosynthesis